MGLFLLHQFDPGNQLKKKELLPTKGSYKERTYHTFGTKIDTLLQNLFTNCNTALLNPSIFVVAVCGSKTFVRVWRMIYFGKKKH